MSERKTSSTVVVLYKSAEVASMPVGMALTSDRLVKCWNAFYYRVVLSPTRLLASNRCNADKPEAFLHNINLKPFRHAGLKKNIFVKMRISLE